MISDMNSTPTQKVSAVILLLLSFSPLMTRAEDLSLVGTEKIILVSPQAVINVIPLAAGAQPVMKITSTSSQSFSTRTESNTLKVIGSGSRATAAPKVDIYVNDVPIEIHLGDGQVNLTKSNNPVLIEMQRGRVVARDSRSAIQSSILAGGLQLTNHQNRVQAEVFRGDMTVKGMAGDLTAVFWQGDVTLEKVQGSIQLKQHQGNTKSADGSGSFLFEIGKATAQINGFKGRIEGSMQEGVLGVVAAPEPEIHVKSQSGKVTISAAGTNSLVTASTEDGDLFPPSSLRVGKVKGTKVIRGRLKGAKPGGRIDVIAQSGQVFLKE